MVYDIFLERNFEPPVALVTWHIEVGLIDEDFRLSIEYARMSTNNTRLLSFNFKMLHRLINNNIILIDTKLRITHTVNYAQTKRLTIQSMYL